MASACRESSPWISQSCTSVLPAIPAVAVMGAARVRSISLRMALIFAGNASSSR